MKKVVGILLVWAMVCAAGIAAEPKGKYAIVLHSGNETNEGMSRAAHALLYAEELAENGYEVALIFDGAGTGWAKVFQSPEYPLHDRYLKIRALGVVEVICDYCATDQGVKDQLGEEQLDLLVHEYRGHSSLVKWIDRGYRIIVL